MQFPTTSRSLATAPRAVLAAGGLLLAAPLHAQEVLFQEGFNTDGAGSRYTLTGRFVSEPADHAANGVSADQTGPVYWEHNFKVSFVGVPAPAPARRAIMAWRHDIPRDAIQAPVLELIDATINWLLKNKANATILWSPPATGDADLFLVERLTAKGHTVVDDDGSALANPPAFDLVVHSSSGTLNASRFTTYRAPLLTFNAADHDDELVSSIGSTVTTSMEKVKITAASHPAAGGKTGELNAITGDVSIDLIGDLIPNTATTVATFDRPVPPTLTGLADVDAMIAGTKQSDKTEATLDSPDLSLASATAAGNWLDDREVPGSPSGVFAIVARGRINVQQAGTYSFALGTDDGGRLRIDLDKSGTFTAADNVIVVDSAGAFRDTFGDANFTATGEYDFEWVAFNTGGAFGSEVSVAITAGAGKTGPVNNGEFELLGTPGGASPVKLVGTIAVTTYVPAGETQVETRPFIVVIEDPADGGSVFGGGPFTGFEGTGFFAGAALNKFTAPDGTANTDPKIVEFASVNTAGKQNLRFSMLAAATFLDFETSDYLDVEIDTGNGWERLIRFTAPSGNDKYFDDRTTNPQNPTRLGLEMKRITYPIPGNPTSVKIRILALTSWWNEIVGFDDVQLLAGAVAEPLRITGIGRSGNDVSLTWTGGSPPFVIQGTPALGTPWTNLATTSERTRSFPATGAAGFFRIQD